MPVNIYMAKHTVDSPNNGIIFRDVVRRTEMEVILFRLQRRY